MNPRAGVEVLGFGTLCLAVSFLVVFVGREILCGRIPGFMERIPAWWRRNLWAGWLFALVLVMIGAWSLKRVVGAMSRGGEVPLDDLLVGTAFVVLGLAATVWRKQLVLWQADSVQRWLDSAREHPWVPAAVFFLVGAAFGMCGIAMLYDWVRSVF